MQQYKFLIQSKAKPPKQQSPTMTKQRWAPWDEDIRLWHKQGRRGSMREMLRARGLVVTEDQLQYHLEYLGLVQHRTEQPEASDLPQRLQKLDPDFSSPTAVDATQKEASEVINGLRVEPVSGTGYVQRSKQNVSACISIVPQETSGTVFSKECAEPAASNPMFDNTLQLDAIPLISESATFLEITGQNYAIGPTVFGAELLEYSGGPASAFKTDTASRLVFGCRRPGSSDSSQRSFRELSVRTRGLAQAVIRTSRSSDASTGSRSLTIKSGRSVRDVSVQHGNGDVAMINADQHMSPENEHSLISLHSFVPRSVADRSPFYSFGRVFAIYERFKTDRSSKWITRRGILVKESRSGWEYVRITSYNGKGPTESTLSANDIEAHALVYLSGSEVRLPSRVPRSSKKPLEIVPTSADDFLRQRSHVCFMDTRILSDPVKAHDIGMVADWCKPMLQEYCAMHLEAIDDSR